MKNGDLVIKIIIEEFEIPLAVRAARKLVGAGIDSHELWQLHHDGKLLLLSDIWYNNTMNALQDIERENKE